MRINSENKSMDMEVRDINYILPAYVRSYLFYSKNEMPEKIIFPMFASVKVGDKSIPIEYVPPLDAVAVEIAQDTSNIAEVTEEQEVALNEKDEEIKRLKAEVESLTTVERGEDGVGGTVSTEPITSAAEHKEDVPITPAPEDLIRQQEETAAEEYEAEHGDTPIRPDGSVPAARAAFAEPEPKKEATPPASPDRLPKQPPGGDIGPGQPLSDTQPRDSKDQARTTRDLLVEPDIAEAKEKPFEKEISRDKDGKPIVEEKPDATD